MNYIKKGFVNVNFIILVGAILVALAFFLPIEVWFESPYSLLYYYQTAFEFMILAYVIALILYPATIAVSLFSFFVHKPKLGLIAGILGIVGFIGIIMGVTEEINIYGSNNFAWGYGLWVSLLGVILLLLYYPINRIFGVSEPKGPAISQAPAATPQEPSTTFATSQTYTPPVCQTCGAPLTFVTEYNRWYCQNCKKYL